MAEFSLMELKGKRVSLGRTLSDGVAANLFNEKRLAVFTSGGDAQVNYIETKGFACCVAVKAKKRYHGYYSTRTCTALCVINVRM